MSKKERIDLILNRIRSGISNAQILDEIDKNNTAGQQALERGETSESNVMRVLRQMDFVTRVTRVAGLERYDQNGIDIKAEIPIPGVGAVNIQVKSSEAGISKMRQKLAQSHQLNGDDEIETWIKRNRTVIVNGRLTDDTIAASFKRQVLQIHQFKSKERGKKPIDYWVKKLS